ncbi:MAG TPA: hypothetical protein VGH43_04320 [Jatrophihabitans sp.]|jgi:hypothetical protein
MTDAPEPDGAVAVSRQERRTQLEAAGLLVAALAVIGAVLGLVWEAWSPPGPAGAVLSAGIQADETEAWVAGDARYALIMIVLGAVAGILAWYLPPLRRVRGPYVAAGVALGCLVAAALTDLVGWAVRGDGSTYPCGVGHCIDHLPLTVHMHGLWFVGPFVAILVYGLFVAFAVADDLGRPDEGRERDAPPPSPPPVPSSVGPEGYPQYGGGHGDAPGMPH